MNATVAVSVVDLLLQIIDRGAAASAVIRQARAEGREPNAQELATLRSSLDQHITELDTAIAQARAEGR